jgi:hypothetical protein
VARSLVDHAADRLTNGRSAHRATCRSVPSWVYGGHISLGRDASFARLHSVGAGRTPLLSTSQRGRHGRSDDCFGSGHRP